MRVKDSPQRNRLVDFEDRRKLLELLSDQLAHTVDLSLKATQARWNLAGSCCHEAGVLFAALAEELTSLADRLAERLVHLGGHAIVAAGTVAGRSTLREYPGDALTVSDHIHALLSSYSQYEYYTKQSLKAAKRFGDSAVTAVLQTITACVERDLWYLEAYLEAFAIGSAGRDLPAWSSAAVAPFRSRSSRKAG